MQAMEEEILYLRSQMALLQSRLASAQDNINADVGFKKLDDSDDAHISLNTKRTHTNNDSCELNESAPLHIYESLSETQNTGKLKSTQLQSMAKQSACVRLSVKLSENQSQNVGHREEAISTEQYTEYDRHAKAPTTDVNAKSTCTVNSEQEMQRLQRTLDYTRVQNNVLSLNFADCKATCEHLYLLCGKYESNALALNQALNLSDRTVEAYDVMLALLESKLALFEKTESAIENRKTAERVAKHLMQRLESDRSIGGNSMGPWHDAASVMSTNSTGNQVWTDIDDLRLRQQMSRLKGQRANIQNTVVIFESSHRDYEPSLDKSLAEQTMTESYKADLETAVLLEELLSVKEYLTDMKYRAEQLNREKNLALDAMLHLQEQLADSEALLAISNKDRLSYSEAEQSAGIELELVEALARESRLKARLQALTSSLETATRTSEEKYFQVQSTVAELKQANL